MLVQIYRWVSPILVGRLQNFWGFVFVNPASTSISEVKGGPSILRSNICRDGMACSEKKTTWLLDYIYEKTLSTKPNHLLSQESPSKGCGLSSETLTFSTGAHIVPSTLSPSTTVLINWPRKLELTAANSEIWSSTPPKTWCECISNVFQQDFGWYNLYLINGTAKLNILVFCQHKVCHVHYTEKERPSPKPRFLWSLRVLGKLRQIGFHTGKRRRTHSGHWVS